MYYYIFDPPQGPKEYERTAQIKEYLASLGIAGEMSAPMPGRPVEELVRSALAKRYSTIIAVGGIELVNRTARALIEDEAVFGIIPTMEHPDITKLIGVSDWRQAAEQLKRRRFQPVLMGSLNEEVNFLTPATITLPAKVHYELRTRAFRAYGEGGIITITPPQQQANAKIEGLLVEINQEESTKKGLLSKIFNTNASFPTRSRFMLKDFELSTTEIVAVEVAGTAVSATPLHCMPQTKPLKLIVARTHNP